MSERIVTLPSGVGLHARPAALFVQAASRTPTAVTLARPGEAPVDATSILSVLGLGVSAGEQVVLAAEGEDAERVLDELAEMLSTAEASGGGDA